jgi:hypothetical protein
MRDTALNKSLNEWQKTREKSNKRGKIQESEVGVCSEIQTDVECDLFSCEGDDVQENETCVKQFTMTRKPGETAGRAVLPVDVLT